MSCCKQNKLLQTSMWAIKRDLASLAGHASVDADDGEDIVRWDCVWWQYLSAVGKTDKLVNQGRVWNGSSGPQWNFVPNPHPNGMEDYIIKGNIKIKELLHMYHTSVMLRYIMYKTPQSIQIAIFCRLFPQTFSPWLSLYPPTCVLQTNINIYNFITYQASPPFPFAVGFLWYWPKPKWKMEWRRLGWRDGS